jgi:hypothetical protein
MNIMEVELATDATSDPIAVSGHVGIIIDTGLVAGTIQLQYKMNTPLNNAWANWPAAAGTFSASAYLALVFPANTVISLRLVGDTNTADLWCAIWN